MKIKRSNPQCALIDGDVVAYMVAAACDGTYYTTVDGASFQYMKEASSHCKKEVLKRSLKYIEGQRSGLM